jgi:L-ascorbate metabolism protein UlaG (beta-lactamase superfamily)
VRRVAGGRGIPVYGNDETSRVLEEAGLPSASVVSAGPITVADLRVDVSEWAHETIYPGLPVPADYAYLIEERVFAPGDSFAVPDFAVDVLLLPTGAPWLKLSDTIDYMRAVAPNTVVPVHDGGLARAHREMHRTLMQKFAPEGTVVFRPEIGDALALDGA